MISSTTDSHAVFAALALHAQPARVGEVAAQPLPRGMLEVIRIASGQPAPIAEWAAGAKVDPERLREAAVFFVEQVLMHRNADHYRVLGLRSDAAEARIREHYRALMGWLHPDRHQAGWHEVFAERVNRAYGALRRADSRSAYDVELAANPPGVARPEPRVPLRRVPRPPQNARAARRPLWRRAAGFAAVAGTGGAAFGAMWWLATAEVEQPVVVVVRTPVPDTVVADVAAAPATVAGNVAVVPVAASTAVGLQVSVDQAAVIPPVPGTTQPAAVAASRTEPDTAARATAESLRRALEQGDLMTVLDLLARDDETEGDLHIQVATGFQGMRDAVRADEGLALREVRYTPERYAARYESRSAVGRRNAPYLTVDFARHDDAWRIRHIGAGTEP